MNQDEYYIKKHLESLLQVRGNQPQLVQAQLAEFNQANLDWTQFKRVNAPPKNPVRGMIVWPDGRSYDPFSDGGTCPIYYTGTIWVSLCAPLDGTGGGDGHGNDGDQSTGGEPGDGGTPTNPNLPGDMPGDTDTADLDRADPEADFSGWVIEWQANMKARLDVRRTNVAFTPAPVDPLTPNWTRNTDMGYLDYVGGGGNYGTDSYAKLAFSNYNPALSSNGVQRLSYKRLSDSTRYYETVYASEVGAANSWKYTIDNGYVNVRISGYGNQNYSNYAVHTPFNYALKVRCYQIRPPKTDDGIFWFYIDDINPPDVLFDISLDYFIEQPHIAGRTKDPLPIWGGSFQLPHF